MKGIIITLFILAFIGGGVYFYKNNTVKIDANNTAQLLQKFKEDNFGDLAGFIRDDLSDKQIGDLKKILAENNISLKQAKELMKNAFNSENGDMEQAFGQLSGSINNIQTKLAPYIKKDKINSLKEYFRNLGAEIETEYIRK